MLPKGCIFFCLGTVVVAFSCVVIGMTAHELAGLTEVTQLTPSGFVNGTGTCMLSSGGKDQRICEYAYAAGSVSLIIALGIIIIQSFLSYCCTSASSDGCCGNMLGYVLHVVVTLISAVMLMWWLIASSIFTEEMVKADSNDLPKADARHAVVASSWLLTIIWLAYLLLTFCAGCCTRSEYSRADEERSQPTKAKPTGKGKYTNLKGAVRK